MTARANRIVILVPDLYLGGAELVMLRLAEEFVKARREVHLVSLVGDGPLEAKVPEGVMLHSVVGRRALDRNGFLLAASALPSLVRLLRDIGPDAALSSMTGTNLLAVVAHRLSRSVARLVLREESSTTNLRSRFKRIALPILYARADAVVAVSDGVARDIRSLGVAAERVHVVHNPVDVQRLRKLADVGPKLACSDCGPYVMSLGRLTEAKDYPTLLRAYAASTLRSRHRLLIVGEGEQRANLENLVGELGLEDCVQLPGAMDNPYRVLADAALLVLSSRWEGLGNVLLEAMALGVPVASTDCPHGPRELLDGGRFGRLAPVGDPVALARAMDDELAHRAAAVGAALMQYDPHLVASRHLELLDGERVGSAP